MKQFLVIILRITIIIKSNPFLYFANTNSISNINFCTVILDKVIALYPYEAQNDDELSFEKDDIISVLGRDEPEWWRGELRGLSGLFPSNYVGPFVTSGKSIIETIQIYH